MNRRNIGFNAATFMAGVILIYVLVVVISAARRKPVTIYQVSKSDVNNNIVLTGLAIREETLISSAKAGYSCYYIREGEKVKKNSVVCTVDSTGKVYSAIEDAEAYDNLLTKEDYQDIRNLISLYKSSYRDVDFYDVYTFETNVDSKVLELTSELLMQQATDSGLSLASVTTPKSGVVAYYTDGFETFDPTKLSAESFDRSKYDRKTLNSGEMIQAGATIIKVVPNETWHIYAPITQDQINEISEDEYVTIRLNAESYTTTMPYQIINGSDGLYIDITISKFMNNFISERYLSVEILLADDTGLKVPNSSLVDKDIYKIPLEYFKGEDHDFLIVNYLAEDDSRKDKEVFPTVYKTDDKYAYVDPGTFEGTDVIKNIDTGNTIAVSLIETDKLKGVYSANRGAAEFRMIEIVKTIDEFTLIEGGGELSPYDNIVLDSSKVTENQVLY